MILQYINNIEEFQQMLPNLSLLHGMPSLRATRFRRIPDE